MPSRRKSQISEHGFTLIELIITITIIGILSGIVAFYLPGSQRQARDAQRKSDLAQYRTLLETSANANNNYYISRVTAQNVSQNLCTDLSLTPCINDPKSGYYYQYESDGSGNGNKNATQYLLWSKLESDTLNYWVVCSNGKSGKVLIWSNDPASGTCPL